MTKTYLVLSSAILLAACTSSDPADDRLVLELSSADGCEDPVEICLETYPPQCSTYCADEPDGGDGDCVVTSDGELVCGDLPCLELRGADGSEVVACAGPDCSVSYDVETETESIHCGGGSSGCESPDADGGCSIPGTDGSGGSGSSGSSGGSAGAGSCAPGGTPWDGEPVACDFLVDDCCYASADDACAAAGCASERCGILESYPAQVSCEAHDCPEGGDGSPECPIPA